MRRLLTVAFMLVVLLCGFTSDMLAQSSCTSSQTLGAPYAPIGFHCVAWGNFVFLLICWYQNASCAPAAGPIESCQACNSKRGGATASGPINLSSGNTWIAQSDIKIPGLSNGLTLERTWNSRWPSTQMASQVGLFGPNWRSTYEERVFLGSDNYMKYSRSDGNFWSFGFNGGNWTVAAPSNVSATLSQGNSYWTLTFQNGEQRLFDITSGWLTRIIDRNGNTTQLTYDGLSRLITVTDPASRHLNFTYTSSTSYLVASVSSDVGLTVTYTYDSQNRLSKVTKPDLTNVTFQYDSNSFITAVLDNDGKTLEAHTYDSNGRGLTGSQAGGVNAVTLSYPH